jgi:hypothetical protein
MKMDDANEVKQAISDFYNGLLDSKETSSTPLAA